MIKPRVRLGYGEGRDVYGTVHIPIKPGLYMDAACSGVALGTNEEGLKRYCRVCFPERQGKVRTRVGAFKIKPEYVCEEIEPDTTSWASELVFKPKPKSDKTIDQILRKPSIGFARRRFDKPGRP